MKCPYCQAEETKVVDKRETETSFATRRRRECLGCSKRFTTYERIESVSLIVIKKDGNRQQFDKTKMEKGILRACEKRPVPIEKINEIVEDIDFHLRNKNTTEIASALIGRMIMNRLKKIDKVAYIRFASVYKDFKDPEEFQEELEKL
jgi:transcriptional repressor NrdR